VNDIVSTKELHRFLSKFGIKFTEDDLNYLTTSAINTSKEGIDYQSFSRMFLPQTSKTLIDRTKM